MTYAKILAFAATVLATSASFAASMAEASYPQVEQSAAARSRSDVAAEAARWNSAGQPGLVRGEDRPEFVQSRSEGATSRSAVIADRDAFARSGSPRIGDDA
jgi:hypothetical protein